MTETTIETRRFENADERLDMKEHGGIDIVKIPAVTQSRTVRANMRRNRSAPHCWRMRVKEE